jgi:hypothetical protein
VDSRNFKSNSRNFGLIPASFGYNPANFPHISASLQKSTSSTPPYTLNLQQQAPHTRQLQRHSQGFSLRNNKKEADHTKDKLKPFT